MTAWDRRQSADLQHRPNFDASLREIRKFLVDQACTRTIQGTPKRSVSMPKFEEKCLAQRHADLAAARQGVEQSLGLGVIRRGQREANPTELCLTRAAAVGCKYRRVPDAQGGVHDLILGARRGAGFRTRFWHVFKTHEHGYFRPPRLLQNSIASSQRPSKDRYGFTIMISP